MRCPALLFVAIAALAAAVRAAPAIRWQTEAQPLAVEVTGLAPEQLRALADTDAKSDTAAKRALAVFAEQESAKTTPAMTGTWSVREGALCFTPQFPLMRGVRYRAEFRGAPGAAPLVSFFELPADTTAPTTTIAQVFPSGDVLPENQLKFYVQFSAPMSRGGTYEHVHIRDAAGAKIDLPFLELDEELWDPSMTRLTLLIDPGRIKRGVKPLEDIGPVFEAGKTYALAFDAACRDAAGRPLRAAFSKKFRIGAADRTPPDPARWKIRAPAADTREPLVVDFDEPLDHALALRLIRVERSRGVALEGEPALTKAERRWSFTPARPWERGAHALAVATTIEDLAGNNIGKTFDVDLSEGAPRRLASESVRVELEIK